MPPKTKRRNNPASGQTTTPQNETSWGQNVDSDTKPRDKTEVRRNQVRKAQVQHRQRKANYVRELEKDIARMREQVAAEQCEAQALFSENNAMRAQLQQVVNQTSPLPLSLDEEIALLSMAPQLPLFGNEVGVEGLDFTINFDEATDQAYYFDEFPSPSQEHPSALPHYLMPQIPPLPYPSPGQDKPNNPLP